MFTGIIEERGTVRRAGRDRLVVGCRKVLRDADVGSSIAVNGACLTVVDRSGSDGSGEGALSFDLSSETLNRTALGRLAEGDAVNLERSVTMLARLGGHLVQGHVDGVGEIADILDQRTGKEMWIRHPATIARHVVDKGSIAVDGVSLTVAGVRDGVFGVALVPYTLEATTLGTVRRGDPVNLETDVLAKYLEAIVHSARGEKKESA
jgi:riboflavin synthase